MARNRSTSAKPADTHVALLRGINVGGKNKMPMKDLVGMFVDVGCSDVQSYIQSGNVVFKAEPALARRIPTLIAQAISRALGLSVPVVTRTAAELRRVAQDNPFLRAGVDAAVLHVAFLAERPAPAAVASLDPDRSPPDQFQFLGQEIYLRLPNGVARTKLTNAYFDSKLATTSTLRNWNTVTKLVELAGGG